jgi:8-oxo-dGTP diphosphatase
MAEVPVARVGCELLICKGDSLLFGKRKNCYGAGSWGLPGGHLIFNERLVDAACREAKEELGVDIKPTELNMVSVVDDLQAENNLHYIHVSFELRDPAFEPKLMEPERCEEWRYFPISELPQDIFGPHKAILENYLEQRFYVY